VVEVDQVVHPLGEDDLAVDGQLDALVQVDDCPKQTIIPQSCDEAKSDYKTRLLATIYNNNSDQLSIFASTPTSLLPFKLKSTCAPLPF
jgi:hypothetical protein